MLYDTTPLSVEHMFTAVAAHIAQSITTRNWVQMYVITFGMFVIILPAFINNVLVLVDSILSQGK